MINHATSPATITDFTYDGFSRRTRIRSTAGQGGAVLSDARHNIEKGVLPPGSKADAEHIAYSTLHQMDLLVSWNFRHLANVSRRDKVTLVNLSEGYVHPLNLVTPLEVLGNE